MNIQLLFSNLVEKIMKAISGFITELKDRRIHVVIAYYYIGAWQFFEPLIAFFGFEPETTRQFRNLAIAVFPLVLVFTWYHGKPGKQLFTKSEKLIYLPTLLISIWLYSIMPQLPKPEFSIVIPQQYSQEIPQQNEVLERFANQNGIRLQKDYLKPGTGTELQQLIQMLSDSNNILLAKVPLIYFDILMNQKPEIIYSYDELFRKTKSQKPDHITSFLSNFNAAALRFGRQLNKSGELYGLPAEFEFNHLVYRKSKLQEVISEWQYYANEIDSCLDTVTGNRLPTNYRFEENPAQWNAIDFFVALFVWQKSAQNTPKKEKGFAFACQKDREFFSLLVSLLGNDINMVDMLFQPQMNQNPPQKVTESFYWFSIFREKELFSKYMWLGSGLSNTEIIECFEQGNLDAAILPSCSIRKLLEDSAIQPDLGISFLPAEFSTLLDKSRKDRLPNILYWVIPKNTPDKVLSLEMATWLTSEKQQVNELSERFILPTCADLEPINLSGFTSDIEKEVWQQFVEKINKMNILTISPFGDFNETGYYLVLEYYFQRWKRIVLERSYLINGVRIDRETIAAEFIIP